MGNQQVSDFREDYKVIEEFPRWEINSKGDIRSVETKEPKYVRLNGKGYYVAGFIKHNKFHNRTVHRLVAKTFLHLCEELEAKCEGGHWGVPVVKHLDNCKTNNSVDNLCWDSNSNNSKDAWKDGIMSIPAGEKNGRAKLTDEQVHEICKAFEEGMMPKEAEKVFSISPQQASKIRAGHSWVSISKLYNIKVNKRKVKTSTTSRKTYT